MLEIALASTLFFNTIVGFRNEADPTKNSFYTSGLEGKDINFNLKPRTGFAVLRMPVHFRYNNYYNPLPPGFYEIETVFRNDKPVQFNYRQLGQIRGTSLVTSYEKLTYTKETPTASIEYINHGKMAKISVLVNQYKVSSLIELENTN